MRPSNRKKTVACIAVRSAPPGKRMGHVEAVIVGNTGTAESNIKAFENAGVKVAELLTRAIGT